jgi:RNA polymerase sigma-70 factor (ECF subfamily)
MAKDKPQTGSMQPERRESDARLAYDAAAGDESAMKKLVDRVMDRVRDTAVYLMGSGPDAEDCSQESLIQVLRSIGGFRGDCALEYWADRITVRTTMHQVRKTRRRERLSANIWEAPPEPVGFDHMADLKRIRVRLAGLLQKISKERRLAVVLHHVHGYDVTEISEMTDALPNTVRDRLNKGRKLLKKHIADDPVLEDWIGRRDHDWA